MKMPIPRRRERIKVEHEFVQIPKGMLLHRMRENDGPWRVVNDMDKLLGRAPITVMRIMRKTARRATWRERFWWWITQERW